MESKKETFHDSNPTIIPKLSPRFIIIIIILSIIILLLIVGIIILGVKKRKEKIITKEININNDEIDQAQKLINYILDKAGYVESWNELYGQNISNISYAKNDIIEPDSSSKIF